MAGRSLEQALDMTAAERAELRARVEKLARNHAKRRLFYAASQAQDAPRDTVQQWDARTSANDARAALSLACGHDPTTLDPTTGTHP